MREHIAKRISCCVTGGSARERVETEFTNDTIKSLV